MDKNKSGHLQTQGGDSTLDRSESFRGNCCHVAGKKERVEELIEAAIDAITRGDHGVLANLKVELLLLEGVPKKKITEVCAAHLNSMISGKYSVDECEQFSQLAREIGADDTEMGEVIAHAALSTGIERHGAVIHQT